MQTSILLAIKREQRNRRSDGFRGSLYDKQVTKASQDAVITHVTQVTVEDAPMTKLEEPATEDTRSLLLFRQLFQVRALQLSPV